MLSPANDVGKKEKKPEKMMLFENWTFFSDNRCW
jgi:hypothetical protein